MTLISRRIVLPSFVTTMLPPALSSILSIDLGPRHVRMTSATAWKLFVCLFVSLDVLMCFPYLLQSLPIKNAQCRTVKILIICFVWDHQCLPSSWNHAQVESKKRRGTMGSPLCHCHGRVIIVVLGRHRCFLIPHEGEFSECVGLVGEGWNSC